MRIADRVFLVTGGASGLGRAVAEHLTGAGGRVVIADIAEGGAEVATQIGCRFVRTDVADETEGRAAIAACLEAHGRLDGLVTCAGIVTGARVLGRSGPHDLDSFARTVRVNLVGTFNMVRLAAEAIAAQVPDTGGARGVIVTTSSIAAFDGQVGQAAYAASKGGVASLTLPLARDLASHGIRVVSVAPGIFETPMMAGLAPEVQEALGRSVPFPPRLGRPAEFAGLVAHIIENDMLNGEVIRLDGALRMAPR
ncbi:SDR family NAD(P)-dependent oxidoreductase [Methylobacterium dankookense]|uniref:Oxidoreductase n=1 Tax=Methylobacterium dankookense TaxID=560405 RepID=A0A564G7F2_9HYPH|nr:SDR family NAD(P)-dependent oxidoreductase [Methylobacterium dankookense]GJD59421.1 putative oxidoreductase [Methylobacterium dankookense]VUF15956.1 putative oxidoreductase [Methylobacterium dankookense]